jgi:hypothetical protein
MKRALFGGSLAAASLFLMAQAAPIEAQSAPAMANPHTMSGEVTKVDPKRGWIDVKTPEGSMKLHFPPGSLEGVKKGDSVTVELGMATVGSAKTK